jgi:hypothetical protein
MIGIFAEHSATFLRVTAILSLLAFAIPITLAPLAWARVLRWPMDPTPQLATYFGRCLGVVALTLVWGAWTAAGEPALQPFFFVMQISGAALLALVHVVGALEKSQPWTETAEIPFWGGLALLGLAFYPEA